MSDIKQVNINVPIPKVKKERKTRKSEKSEKVMKTIEGGNPMPVLSTIRVGGEHTNNIVQSLNKPTIKINIPNTDTNKTLINLPSAKKITPNSVKIVNSKKPLLRKTITDYPKVNIQPNKRRNFTLKRKFSSKNITIHIENANSIKKSRENIENKVKVMNEDEISKKLIARGLMRPTANPPLKWKQNMMRDIMLFPTRL